MYKCAYCGKEIDPEKDEVFMGEGCNIYCSEDCRADNEPEKICEYCGEYSKSTQWEDDLDMYICDTCYNEETVECGFCGRRVFHEDSYYSDITDDYYCCDDCMYEAEGDENEHSSWVNDYGYSPDLTFYRTEEEEAEAISKDIDVDDLRYYGVEIELDADEPQCNAEEDIGCYYDGYVYLKTDGSLNEGGIEIVSHPMTLDYHKNVMNWGNLLDTAVNGGLEASHRTGFHVHISNNSFSDVKKTQANLVRFFTYFWKNLVIASRRKQYQLDNWAKCPSSAFVSETDLFNSTDDDLIAKIKHYGRYFSVNLTNYDTTEIRIFAGLDDVTTLHANLELVDNIVEICDTLSWDEIKNLSWRDVCDYKNKTSDFYAGLVEEEQIA